MSVVLLPKERRVAVTGNAEIIGGFVYEDGTVIDVVGQGERGQAARFAVMDAEKALDDEKRLARKIVEP